MVGAGVGVCAAGVGVCGERDRDAGDSVGDCIVGDFVGDTFVSDSVSDCLHVEEDL